MLRPRRAAEVLHDDYVCFRRRAIPTTSEAYRRANSGTFWPGQALVIRMLKGEKQWNHDAFFDYCDRWMFEDDKEFLKTLKDATGQDHDQDWFRQGKTREPFVNEMWAKYRTAPGMPPTDGWKKQHDDSYLKNAIERAQKASTKPS